MPEEKMVKYATAVAIGLIFLVVAVTVAAVVRYNVDDALKIWSALGTVVGVLTGAVVTYFFTRGTIAAEKQNAQRELEAAKGASEEARTAREHAEKERNRAVRIQSALTQAAGLVDGTAWAERVSRDPIILEALRSE